MLLVQVFGGLRDWRRLVDETRRVLHPRGTLILVHLRYAIAAPLSFFGLPGLVLLNMLGGWLVRGWDRIALRYSFSLPTMVFYLAGLAALYFLGRSFTVQTLYPIGFFVAAVCFLSFMYPPRQNLARGFDDY